MKQFIQTMAVAVALAIPAMMGAGSAQAASQDAGYYRHQPVHAAYRHQGRHHRVQCHYRHHHRICR